MIYNWQIAEWRLLKKKRKRKIEMNIQGDKFLFFPHFDSHCVQLHERWPFSYIINLHEILKEVTVATKHLKILKMPAKVMLNIPSLPLRLFLPDAYCNLSWLLREQLSFSCQRIVGNISHTTHFLSGCWAMIFSL